MYTLHSRNVKEKKNKYHIVTLKSYVLPFIFLMFTICLLIFSSSNLTAAKKGLNLWANSVVPSLFPFFVATELLSRTEVPYFLGKLLGSIMKPLFNVRGEGSFALIMGLISGYPIGAKIATNFRQNNVCSKEECERILSFTNNSGPLFIIGTVGISMFGSSTIGILLLITHVLSSLTVGIIFRYWKKNSYTLKSRHNQDSTSNKNIKISDLGEILSQSITNSISTILVIGGFVVLFSVIISMFKASNLLDIITNFFTPVFELFKISPKVISPLFTGLFEITNGIASIASVNIKAISINIILSSFLLGIGGISIFFQVFSIVSKSDLSIKPYIYGKFLHGIIAAIYTFGFMQIIPMFNLNL